MAKKSGRKRGKSMKGYVKRSCYVRRSPGGKRKKSKKK